VLNQKTLKLGYLNINMETNHNLDQKIFRTNPNFFNGTEFMVKNFKEKVMPLIPKIKNYNCIVLPGEVYDEYDDLVKSEKKIIFWIHNLVEQFDANKVTGDKLVEKYFNTKDFVKKIKCVIVVSEYAKQEMLKSTILDESQIVVIHNAIDPIFNDTDRFKDVKNIKIIHTSASFRGFEILARSLKYIEHDFRLSVYNDIDPDIYEVSPFFKEIYKDKRLFFYSRTPKKTIIDDLSKSHIFAYPSIYKETFCLSQAEAISAGCLPVYRDYGALKEVSLNAGVSYKIEESLHFDEEHVKIFASKLTSGIELIKSNKFNIKNISEEINQKFSWENFKKSWINLHEKL
jgi:glycosyltransferase involved in cell wall biosynthesis